MIWSVQKQPGGVLKIFASFTGKHLCRSLFNKFAHIQGYNFIQKRLQHRHFPVKFAINFGTPILKNICQQLL